jgi:hypothetical protein
VNFASRAMFGICQNTFCRRLRKALLVRLIVTCAREGTRTSLKKVLRRQLPLATDKIPFRYGNSIHWFLCLTPYSEENPLSTPFYIHMLQLSETAWWVPTLVIEIRGQNVSRSRRYIVANSIFIWLLSWSFWGVECGCRILLGRSGGSLAKAPATHLF